MTNRIALAGPKHSGKDEAARYLASKLGSTPEPISISTPLKLFVYNLYGASDTKPRALLQYLARTLRAYDPDVMLPYIQRQIESLPPDAPILVTGVRFDNEVKLLLHYNFAVIGLIASPKVRAERAPDPEAFWKYERHGSEVSARRVARTAPYIVMNDGAIESLHEGLDEVLQEIRA